MRFTRDRGIALAHHGSDQQQRQWSRDRHWAAPALTSSTGERRPRAAATGARPRRSVPRSRVVLEGDYHKELLLVTGCWTGCTGRAIGSLNYIDVSAAPRGEVGRAGRREGVTATVSAAW